MISKPAAPVAAALAAVLLLAPGCASIVTPGRFRPVKVETHPAGASVYVNDAFEGRTPLVLRVDRKEDHRVRFVFPGKEPFDDTIESGLNGWLFGNLLFGGIIGLVIDGVNGSAAAPKPGKYDVYLLEPGGDYADRDQQKAAKEAWRQAARDAKSRRTRPPAEAPAPDTSPARPGPREAAPPPAPRRTADEPLGIDFYGS